MDEPAFPGCAVSARIIGILEAEQTDDGEMRRNDRVIAVAHDAHDYGQLKTLKDLNPNLLKELEHFFISYNETRGKRFKLLAGAVRRPPCDELPSRGAKRESEPPRSASATRQMTSRGFTRAPK